MLISQPGALAITSAREGAGMGSVADYLNAQSVRPEDSRLPLRALLAKPLVEKNGGRFNADQSNAEKAMVRMEFPIVEYRKKN
jgi:hypothetical protein